MIKRVTTLVLLLCAVCALTSCDAVYRVLQKEGAEEKDLLGEIVPLERNDQVMKIQRLLKLYGYRVGTPDGVLGVNTRNAIEAFQIDNELKPSRFMDRATWEKLIYFEQCGLVVEGKLNITALQRAMKAAGLNVGAVDGRLGRRTQAAIKDFQRGSGLKPDGKVGFKTLKAMAPYVCGQPEPQEPGP